MEFGEHVHWFLTDRCNLKCAFCFKPTELSKSKDSVQKLLTLSEILGSNGVKRVTLGGGEPTMVEGFIPLIRDLNQRGIYVSLHTNAILLNKKRIKELSGFNGEIALPIDSTNSETQTELRGVDYSQTFKRAVHEISGEGIRLAFHSVFTMVNSGDMSRIYQRIKKIPTFDYWKIYEFNEKMVDTKFSSLESFGDIDSLARGSSGEEDGFSDCLIARFLLAEEKMQKYNDSRIKFIGVNDLTRTPYIFLDSSGDIRFYDFFSTKRELVGNLFQEGFDGVNEKLEKIIGEGVLFDEEGFIETTVNLPIWARISDGNCFWEEVDAILPRYYKKVQHLSELYKKRVQRLENLAYGKSWESL